MENHSVDVPWWDSMIEGVEEPLVNRGFITVPDKPGLGITLNEAVVKEHLLAPAISNPLPFGIMRDRPIEYSPDGYNKRFHS